ncbi:MAG: phage holin family protein [Candidatus Omnitrophota bacterium]
MGFFIRWWVNIVALLAVVLFVPGIHVDKFQTALWAALCLGLVNAFLRPLLIAFTLPLNILSLGFFTLLINGFLFFLVSRIVPGFIVMSFWNAVWGALAFSIFSFILNLLVKPSGKIDHPRRNRGDAGNTRRDNVIDVEGKVER